MQPDNSFETERDLTFSPYDTARFPLLLPASLPSDSPLIYRGVSASYWQFIRGMLGRLLYSDAWEGTDEEKADAVQATLQTIDLLQKIPDTILIEWLYDWPSVVPLLSSAFDLLYGTILGSPKAIYIEYASPALYWVFLRAKTDCFIHRVEIDLQWSITASGGLHYFAIYENAVEIHREVLPDSGNRTIVYEPPGGSVEERLTHFNQIDIGVRMQVLNTGLPYIAYVKNIRIYGYGTKLSGAT